MWAYLRGDESSDPLIASSAKFSLVSTTGEVRALRSILENTMSNIIPEVSSSLYVDGEVVRVQLFQQKGYADIRESARFVFCDDDLKDIPGQDGSMVQDMQNPDIPDWTGHYDKSNRKNLAFTSKRYEEALVLLDGPEFDQNNKRYQRMGMMLLKWTGPDRAERAGLLSSLRDDV